MEMKLGSSMSRPQKVEHLRLVILVHHGVFWEKGQLMLTIMNRLTDRRFVRGGEENDGFGGGATLSASCSRLLASYYVTYLTLALPASTAFGCGLVVILGRITSCSSHESSRVPNLGTDMNLTSLPHGFNVPRAFGNIQHLWQPGPGLLQT
jgi:hypothetical protein